MESAPSSSQQVSEPEPSQDGEDSPTFSLLYRPKGNFSGPECIDLMPLLYGHASVVLRGSEEEGVLYVVIKGGEAQRSTQHARQTLISGSDLVILQVYVQYLVESEL